MRQQRERVAQHVQDELEQPTVPVLVVNAIASLQVTRRQLQVDRARAFGLEQLEQIFGEGVEDGLGLVGGRVGMGEGRYRYSRGKGKDIYGQLRGNG